MGMTEMSYVMENTLSGQRTTVPKHADLVNVLICQLHPVSVATSRKYCFAKAVKYMYVSKYFSGKILSYNRLT